MDRRVIWSKNAIKDKIQILDYWYKRIGTKTYSIKLNKSINNSINLLKEYPELRKKMNDSDIRYIVKDHHLIFYKILPEEIQILHIWDSRRNPDELIIVE